MEREGGYIYRGNARVREGGKESEKRMKKEGGGGRDKGGKEREECKRVKKAQKEGGKK